MRHRGNNAWLFAFTDLAFLLLIGLSTVPSSPDPVSLRIGEMEIPMVPDSREIASLEASAHEYKLRVRDRQERENLPFEISWTVSRPGEESREENIQLGEEGLIRELERLRRENSFPLLLPEKTSQSQDLLFAAAAMARVWSTSGRAVVKAEAERK